MPAQPAKNDGPRAPAAQRVRVEVPEAYKRTSDEVWEELEKYLFTGFVYSPASFAGHSFVFKSLNHHEVRNIEFMRPSRNAPGEARATYRTHFIAHSLFMVDGVNVLYERPKHLNRLVRVVSRLDPRIQERIVENLAAVNGRAHRLYPLTEVYAHEPRSRYRWLQLSSIPIHSSLATGTHGTEELGMNYAQQTWTAMNRILDRREEMERDWSNAKFIGSCMSKGVRSVDERDRARAEKERADLEDRKLKVLYNYLNRTEDGKDPPATVQLPDGRMAEVVKKFHADSVEELADQLSAALSGERDHHDLVIDAKIREMRERAKTIEANQRKIYAIAPIPVPETNERIASGGSRILGGRAEAEGYLSRLAELRQRQMESARQVILDRPDPASSDEPSPQDGRRS